MGKTCKDTETSETDKSNVFAKASLKNQVNFIAISKLLYLAGMVQGTFRIYLLITDNYKYFRHKN